MPIEISQQAPSKAKFPNAEMGIFRQLRFSTTADATEKRRVVH